MKMKQSEGSVNILGININSTSKTSLLKKIESDIKANKKFYIVTPNPEQIMLAQKDSEFKDIINKAEIAIPDGIGVIMANRFLNSSVQKLELIKGRELFLDLIKLADEKKWRVFFLGGESGEAEESMRVLSTIYKNIRIETSELPRLSMNGVPENTKDLVEEINAIRKINNFVPHILFIGMTPPKQEKWLIKHFKEINALVSILHGGTFRYIAGYAKMPPKFVAHIGMEWLWRLLTGSQKLTRIYTAVIIFPFEVLKYKILRKN